MKGLENQMEPLYAIFKRGQHIGNVRAKSIIWAINNYLIDSGYSRDDLLHIKLIGRYKAIIAKKKVHF